MGLSTAIGLWNTAPSKHTTAEDAQGIICGTLLVGLGLAIYAHLGFVTSGTAGLALIAFNAFGWPVGITFFIINLPFYLLAIGRLGWPFTLKTFAAVALLSVIVDTQPLLFNFGTIQPIYGAFLGGLLMGFGLLALFRHRASLGGVGILAIYCQERFGWRAGLVQLGIDLCILGVAVLVIAPATVAYSVLGAAILNLFLAINHRADRYIAR